MPRSASCSAPTSPLLLLPLLPLPLPAATRNVALATSKQHVRQTSLESSLPLHPRLPRVASYHRERCWSPRATRVWTTVWTRKRQPLQLVRVPFSMPPFALLSQWPAVRRACLGPLHSNHVRAAPEPTCCTDELALPLPSVEHTR
jgi:hypothetical protein